MLLGVSDALPNDPETLMCESERLRQSEHRSGKPRQLPPVRRRRRY
jgi:hypothetical protein